MNEDIGVKDLSAEEAEAGLDGSGPDVVEEAPEPDESVSETPEWAKLPPGLKLPKAGCTVAYLRVPAQWTTDPSKGDRWCCCWVIGETEERLAYQRARGDMHRSISELAKATIRVVDGNKADWSGTKKPGDVSEFWTAIGPKGRQMVRNYYVRTHTVSEEEQLAFFSQHFAVVTVG